MIWWYFSDKRNNIVTDFIFKKLYLLHFGQILNQTKKNAGTPSIWKCTWVLQIWCIIYVVMLLACHEICFLISDVVPCLGKSIMSNGRQHLLGFCNTVIEMYSYISLDHLKKGFNFAFTFSPPKECGHLHHDPSAEFAHHALWSHQMWLMRMEPVQWWYQNQVTPLVGGCDLSKNITWIMHVLPPKEEMYFSRFLQFFMLQT